MDEPTESSVRAEVRAWLEANWNPELGLVEWRNKLADSGWGVPHWPKQWYGRDLPAVASLAKACAAEAYLQTAIHAVQMHGGIGFTWDNDTHLWFKRAKSSEILFGDANQHRELMMQHWKH